MKAINNPIQSLWIGSELSVMEFLCIESYIQHGHDFHLYVYDPVLNAPPGTTFKDANEIIPRNKITVDSFGGFVNFSNKFRYMLLYKRGGWWVDMDTVCLHPFDFEEDYVFSSETSDPYHRFVVNTTYIKALPQSKFLLDCMDFMDKRGYSNIHWGELGVHLISRMIFRNGLQAYIKPPEYFCPVSGYQLNLLIENNDYKFPSNTYALHFWNELWRRNKLDKNKSYAPQSIYEKLKHKFQVISKYPEKEKNEPDIGSKLSLNDVTFIIPFKASSQEQLENLYVVSEMLKKSFDTNIFIIEVDKIQKVDIKRLPNETKYRYEQNKEEIFNKVNYISRFVTENVNTPIIAYWDSDVIVPSSQILNAVDKIRHYNVKICKPYSGTLFYVDDILGYLFKKTMDISVLTENASSLKMAPKTDSRNDVFLCKTEAFLQRGNIDGDPDDLESVSKLPVIQMEGPIFHLWHPQEREIPKPQKLDL